MVLSQKFASTCTNFGDKNIDLHKSGSILHLHYVQVRFRDYVQV